MEPLLTRRALNRATLDRQLLLRRTTRPVIEVIEHLAGLQAQTPHSWYVGLWNRIEGFGAEETSDLLAERKIARIALMRSTIHLVSARDAVALRPLVQPVIERTTRGAFGGKWVGLDLAEVASVGRELLAERPLTFAELGRLLAERWPGHDPSALGQAVRMGIPLVQVPPRGLWGRSGPIAHTSTESWLGTEKEPVMSPGEMVLRYLAAFGPASVKDVQAWSGVTRLATVVKELDLLRFRDEEGRELYDLPGSPRPAADTPVPARLMYDFDNLFLSHADRSRVVTGTSAYLPFVAANVQPRMILLDGFTAGDWTTTQAKGATTLNLHQWRPFTSAELAEVTAEGARLLNFLAPGDEHAVSVFDRPSKT